MKIRAYQPGLALLILLVVLLVSRNNLHAVIPGEIYRSAQLSDSTLESVVTELGIRTVVSLRRPRPDKHWYTAEIALAESLGLGHYDIALDRTFSPRIDHIMDLRNLIEHASKPMLIHCKAGADRTGLAAVMTKLLDGESDLQQARAEISWKFGVVRDDSMGISFFNAYAGWLARSDRVHTSGNFNYWLENEYVDLSGNIHFLVDPILGQPWLRPWGQIDEGYEFQVRRSDTERLELSGWAFDTRRRTPLARVEVFLEDIRFQRNRYGISQPWLEQEFANVQYVESGWEASHPLEGFGDGCQDLWFRFYRLDGSTWNSPPAARICIGN